MLHDDDWTFTTAQSLRAVDFRHVGADPLYPWRRAFGLTTFLSALLSAFLCGHADTIPRFASMRAHRHVRASRKPIRLR